MKNTRGREERTKGREKWRKEGEIGFRLPDEWRQCQESAAAAPEQISLKNSALLVRRRKKKIRRRREKVAVSSAAVKRRERERERERVVTRNFGQLDRHCFSAGEGEGGREEERRLRRNSKERIFLHYEYSDTGTSNES